MWCEAFAIGVAFGVKLFVMFENDTIGNCVSKHVLRFLWVQQWFSIVLIRFHVCLIRFPLALTMTSCVWNCSCMIFRRFSLCFIRFLMILRCFEVFGCVFEVFWGVWRCAQVSDVYSFLMFPLIWGAVTPFGLYIILKRRWGARLPPQFHLICQARVPALYSVPVLQTVCWCSAPALYRVPVLQTVCSIEIRCIWQLLSVIGSFPST